jgi:hypothetical protein
MLQVACILPHLHSLFDPVIYRASTIQGMCCVYPQLQCCESCTACRKSAGHTRQVPASRKKERGGAVANETSFPTPASPSVLQSMQLNATVSNESWCFLQCSLRAVHMIRPLIVFEAYRHPNECV